MLKFYILQETTLQLPIVIYVCMLYVYVCGYMGMYACVYKYKTSKSQNIS